VIDIQATGDGRGIAIPDVGIAGFRNLVTTGHRGSRQTVVADLSIGVSLPAELRGTHMSRLVEVAIENEDDLTTDVLPVVAKRLQTALGAESGHLSLKFPMVFSQPSPVTGRAASNVHDVTLAVRLDGEELALTATVEVLATSLCPCSKAVSDYGAHNQRSRISMTIGCIGGDAATRLPALEDMVRWAEEACSAPMYPLLKRPDERHVTMQAYDHPVFVEDIVREVVLQLEQLPGPGSYLVRVTNEESIHRHDAYAEIAGLLRSDEIM
jgi:GTP cyclohydrolase I